MKAFAVTWPNGEYIYPSLLSSDVGVFLSSRRRHTRSSSDWSSDVCSSDLAGRMDSFVDEFQAAGGSMISVAKRSEERRVGEEGRSRGSPDSYKKKKKRDSVRECDDIVLRRMRTAVNTHATS